MEDIRTLLEKRDILLFDGAMGTLFAGRTNRDAGQCERANLDAPEEILAIHRAYLEAGCRAIKTNTFSLTASPDEASTRAACRLAREAAGPYGAFVFGDMGPGEDGFLRQAELFLSEGVSCFLAETLSSDEGIPELAAYLKKNCPESFLLVSFAVGADGVTRQGLSGKALLERVSALPGVDAAGFNCMSGPYHLLQLIRGLTVKKPLSVMPNAGYPTVLGRKTVYQGRPDYFAQQLLEMTATASILGGCCGTTPAHIAAVREALSRPRAPETSAPARKIRPLPSENPFWEKLDSGRRVAAVELDPPVNDDGGAFLSKARILRDAGADIITVADCPIGRPRADSSLLACGLRRELSIPALPHMTCRDRNLNAIKALLLGLSMEGVHNVLLVTGDPIPSADRDEVKSVFNFNSRKLIRYVRELGKEELRTPFRIFAALNVNARNFSQQLRLAQEKEENGADGFLTQPVLSEEGLTNLRLAREKLRGRLLAGIYPVVSYKNACFLNNEVSGIHICEEIIRLYEGKDRQEGEELAVRISREIIRATASCTDGIYLMTPFGRAGLAARILKEAKNLPASSIK